MHHALRCCFLKQMTPWRHGLPTQWHGQPGPYAPYSHPYTLQHRCAFAQSTLLTMQTQTHLQRPPTAAYLHHHLATQVHICSVHCTDKANTNSHATAPQSRISPSSPCNTDTNLHATASQNRISPLSPCNTGNFHDIPNIGPPPLSKMQAHKLSFPLHRPNTHPLFPVYTPMPPQERPASTLLPHRWAELLP